MLNGYSYPKDNQLLIPQDNNIQNMTPIPTEQTRKKIKKQVTFNKKVDIIKVQSYKEYNRIDENLFNINNFYTTGLNMNSKNKKSNNECTCNIT